MSEVTHAPDALDHKGSQSAHLVLQTRNGSFEMGLHMTPQGLLAVAGLVSSILLSTSVLVWAAATSARHNPRLSKPLR